MESTDDIFPPAPVRGLLDHHALRHRAEAWKKVVRDFSDRPIDLTQILGQAYTAARQAKISASWFDEEDDSLASTEPS